jgi:hypothetical protein
MDLSKISDVDQQAIRRATEYWVEHWDWECSTLFGIELDELKRILHRWPLIGNDGELDSESATVSALRELIFGASSLPRAAVQETIGISYDQAKALIEALCDDDHCSRERLLRGDSYRALDCSSRPELTFRFRSTPMIKDIDLHDATLIAVRVDWSDGTCIAEIQHGTLGKCSLTFSALTNLTLPRE